MFFCFRFLGGRNYRISFPQFQFFSNHYFFKNMSLKNFLESPSDASSLKEIYSKENWWILILALDTWKSRKAVKRYWFLHNPAVEFTFRQNYWLNFIHGYYSWIFLYVERSSKWVFSIFAQLIDFSWYADKAAKRSCYYLVDIRSYFSKTPPQYFAACAFIKQFWFDLIVRKTQLKESNKKIKGLK